jgi:glycosyltransferase involved in cell wall biosynthesis
VIRLIPSASSAGPCASVPEPVLFLVHAFAPPRAGGTPVVLHRLLGALEGVRLEVVTDRVLRDEVAMGGERVLNARYRYFAKLRPRPRFRAVGDAVDMVNLALAAPIAGIRAAIAARRANASWIVSPADGGFSQVAGAVASRLSGLPRLVFVFDLWTENAYSPVERLAGRMLERRLFASAAAVVVWSQEAADHLRRSDGVEAAVLSIPVDLPEGAEGGEAAPDRNEVFVSGALYWAQEDAARRLLRAASQVPEATVTIVGDADALRDKGLEGDRVEPPVPAKEFQRRAARAGALFVGLSFDSPHPEVVRTATPARFAEYMALGRPIVVHAPAGSHVAEYARAQGFAEVVDRPDEAALAQGLRRALSGDEEIVSRARRARALVAERHDTRLVAARFRQLLDSVRR